MLKELIYRWAKKIDKSPGQCLEEFAVYLLFFELTFGITCGCIAVNLVETVSKIIFDFSTKCSFFGGICFFSAAFAYGRLLKNLTVAKTEMDIEKLLAEIQEANSTNSVTPLTKEDLEHYFGKRN